MQLVESAVEDQVEMVVAAVEAAKLVDVHVCSCAADHVSAAQLVGHLVLYMQV